MSEASHDVSDGFPGFVIGFDDMSIVLLIVLAGAVGTRSDRAVVSGEQELFLIDRVARRESRESVLDLVNTGLSGYDTGCG